MKKYLYVIFVCLLSSTLWGQKILDNNFLIPVDHRLYIPQLQNPWFGFPAKSMLVQGAYVDGYHIVNAYDERTYIYTSADISAYDDGYLYANAGYDKINEPFLVLLGGDILLYFSQKYYTQPEYYFGGQKARMGAFLVGGPEWAYDILKDSENMNKEILMEGGTGFWDDGIKNISVWSTLYEKTKNKTVTYGPERMRHPFYDWADMKINFNNASLFWAEGEQGSGIGGTIEIELTRKSDHLMVLNGAVDLSRRYLYKANNRLKKIRIDSEEPAFTIEYYFIDVVQFHKIILPQQTKNVKITIEEVFKGNKWDDTCISAIFLMQEEVRSRDVYEKVIRDYIKINGFDIMIDDYNKKIRTYITK